MLSAHAKFHVCLLDLSAALDTIDHYILYSLVCPLGLAFTALLKLVYALSILAVFVSSAITISPLYTLVSTVSPKAKFSAFYSLSCILPHSVLSFHLFL